jgi:hypothetical protein
VVAGAADRPYPVVPTSETGSKTGQPYSLLEGERELALEHVRPSLAPSAQPLLGSPESPMRSRRTTKRHDSTGTAIGRMNPSTQNVSGVSI